MVMSGHRSCRNLNASTVLRQDLLYHFPVDIGQAEVESRVSVLSRSWSIPSRCKLMLLSLPLAQREPTA